MQKRIPQYTQCTYTSLRETHNMGVTAYVEKEQGIEVMVGCIESHWTIWPCTLINIYCTPSVAELCNHIP